MFNGIPPEELDVGQIPVYGASYCPPYTLPAEVLKVLKVRSGKKIWVKKFLLRKVCGFKENILFSRYLKYPV